MFNPENVPEAAWKATGLPEADARTAIAAALNAWPGALHRIGIKRHKNGEWRQPYPMIRLPLPQEGGDD